MSEELKPCPICEGQYLNVCSHGETGKCEWHIECDHCGCACPTESETEAEAYAAWNALPRRLKWTREKPTKDGWYWWRTGGDCNLRGIVSVCIETDIMVLAGNYKYLSQTTGEWAGPIPVPEDAE